MINMICWGIGYGTLFLSCDQLNLRNPRPLSSVYLFRLRSPVLMQTDHPCDLPSTIWMFPDNHKPARAGVWYWFLSIVSENMITNFHSTIVYYGINFNASSDKRSRYFSTNIFSCCLYDVILRIHNTALVMIKLHIRRIKWRILIKVRRTGIVCAEEYAVEFYNCVVKLLVVRSISGVAAWTMPCRFAWSEYG